MLELKRLNSIDDLARLHEQARPLLDLRHYERKEHEEKYQILICGGTGCSSSGSMNVRDALQKAIATACTTA